MKRTLLALAVALSFATTLHAADAEDLSRKVRMLGKMVSAGAPSFSPDGKRILFITTISGSPQVWTVAATGG
ncbi:MAG TPA: hypothetical protein VF911_19090, partial [Thermoanaerobaculia bacterium]